MTSFKYIGKGLDQPEQWVRVTEKNLKCVLLLEICHQLKRIADNGRK